MYRFLVFSEIGQMKMNNIEENDNDKKIYIVFKTTQFKASNPSATQPDLRSNYTQTAVLHPYGCSVIRSIEYQGLLGLKCDPTPRNEFEKKRKVKKILFFLVYMMYLVKIDQLQYTQI
jgi:hypothetical protein